MKKYFSGMMAMCVLLLIAARVNAGRNADPKEGLILSNDNVQFRFEPETMGLVSMRDMRTNFEHIKSISGKYPLWEVVIAKGGGATRERKSNRDIPCSRISAENLPDGGQRAIMEWNFYWWSRAKFPTTVQVIIDLPKDSGIATWRILVENLDEYWGLWNVSFPKISGFPESGGYDIARPTFAGGGHLLKNWKERVEWGHPSGFMPMQFIALTHGTNSVYFAGMDPDGRGKDLIADPSLAELAMVHYPENMGVSGSDYPDFYPVEFGVYQGNWVHAAHRYRDWTLRQRWAQSGPLSQRTDVPEILKNTCLWMRDSWIWNGAEGSPHEMNIPFFEIKERMGVPLALHWYNWHHNAFDTEYPHYLPPKPGFRERVKELTDAGLLIMPYINGSSIDMNIPDWERYAPHAIVDEGGGYRVFFYGFVNPLLSMCPNQDFWQDEVSVLVDSLTGYYGCNGVYLDQVLERKHELCFNPEHNHSIGGGRYWTDGNRNLLRKVKGTAIRGGRESVITSEGTDEVLGDLVDASLTWDYPTDRQIPLLFMVYSGYRIYFGSRCEYTLSDRHFNYFQGQCFIDGRQNGWMDFGIMKPEYRAKFEYLRQCARYRSVTRDFLLYGRLWQPMIPENEIPQFEDENFGWPSFMEGTGLGTTHAGSVPCAEARLWQAEDGRLAVFMANYVNEEMPVMISVDPREFGLKASSYRLSIISPEGREVIGNESGTIKQTAILGPNRLKVIEIAAVE